MRNQKPSFEITNDIICKIAEIAELVGKLTILERFASSSVLRRSNRIRMIYGSLALEQSVLTLEQAAAILRGQRVSLPLRDVAKLQNTWEAYERLEEFDPYSLDALLDAHKVLMHGLEGDSGVFRPKKVNLVDESGQVLQSGTLPDYYAKQTAELLEWVRSSEIPILVKSCAFRCEFERIHPFSDGTGRISRLWHTLLLTKWNPLFAFIPVDDIVQGQQSEYYKVMNSANAGDATEFICFMLASIKTSLDMVNSDVIDECDNGVIDGCYVSDAVELAEEQTSPRWEKIQLFLSTHTLVRNADVRTMFGVSPATANRILVKFAAAGKLVKCHEGGHWAYRLPK